MDEDRPVTNRRWEFRLALGVRHSEDVDANSPEGEAIFNTAVADVDGQLDGVAELTVWP